jgi:hypothetical protein
MLQQLTQALTVQQLPLLGGQQHLLRLRLQEDWPVQLQQLPGGLLQLHHHLHLHCLRVLSGLVESDQVNRFLVQVDRLVLVQVPVDCQVQLLQLQLFQLHLLQLLQLHLLQLLQLHSLLTPTGLGCMHLGSMLVRGVQDCPVQIQVSTTLVEVSPGSAERQEGP